ncbi:MAG TPA: hypothetical protein VE528_05495 [Thermoleophilaceae bacterium]|nr:hypothetical protein [Thermoleophilaceae bacterium]
MRRCAPPELERPLERRALELVPDPLRDDDDRKRVLELDPERDELRELEERLLEEPPLDDRDPPLEDEPPSDLPLPPDEPDEPPPL